MHECVWLCIYVKTQVYEKDLSDDVEVHKNTGLKCILKNCEIHGKYTYIYIYTYMYICVVDWARWAVPSYVRSGVDSGSA